MFHIVRDIKSYLVVLEVIRQIINHVHSQLLFMLVYQKSYPLQSILAELFGISQGRANEWIHRLLPILKQALADLGVLPERDPKKFKAKAQHQKDTSTSIIDATMRVLILKE